MKKGWKDPVKNQPPHPETLAIEGSWNKFTADMKAVLRIKPESPALKGAGDVKPIGR